MNDRQVPLIAWRCVFYRAVMEDPVYSARLKLNGSFHLRNGRPERPRNRFAGWGTWCHSFHSYVSPKEYFKEHPEYFAFFKGKRRPRQLCLTNPEVLRLTIQTLARKIEEHPEADIWDVSQMDGGGDCKCSNCRAVNVREGGPMGSILTFVNAIARKFPEKKIATLSYYYSQHAPKTLRPEPNVRVKLCAYGAKCDVPYERQGFAKTLRKWSAISDNLFIWDYNINFANLYMPHPNFRTLQPNLRFFVKNKVWGVFAQCNREIGGEFWELRAYVLAHLLWNPDCDVEAEINDFLAAYYGPAAQPIRRYFDAMHDAMEKAGRGLHLYATIRGHRNGFLRPEMLGVYAACFDDAERRVKDAPVFLARVRAARMPLMYVQLVTQFGPAAARKAQLETFYELCRENGIRRLSETGNPPEAFRARVRKQIDKELQ